jgi:hypothetical protein
VAAVKEAPPDLPAVVKEIATALLDGDWIRYADDSGEHFYYIVRRRDHAVKVNGDGSHTDSLVGEPAVSGTFEDWYIRAALAEEPADRLAKARKRVEAAGVDPRFFDAVIEVSRSANSPAELSKMLVEWAPKFGGGLDALNAVLEALLIDRVKQKQIFVSGAHRPDIRRPWMRGS